MKKIYLIDGNSFIYRMFFALPEFATKEGVIVNALFGMAKFFVWQIVKENPDYVIFIKDAKWDNFRHQIYADYKATRERMPDNLRSQIALIEEMITKMWFPIIEIDNCEADDVIGTLATSLGVDPNNDIYILSGDKDLYSLTTKNVKIYDTMKGKIFDDVGAKEKFLVDAPLIIDYLAIIGDTSDNIPGVAGFWPKKAVDLIGKYGTVENIFAHIDDEDFILSGKTLEKLKEWKEMAFLSKQLATIKKDIELDNFHLDKFFFEKNQVNNDEVKDFFRKYEFFSLLTDEPQKPLQKWDDLWLKVNYITSKALLDTLFEKIKAQKEIVLDTETTSLLIHSADITGVSVCIWENELYYINHLHEWEKVSREDLQDFLKNLFDLDILIVGHNIKYDLEVIELFLKKNIATKKAPVDTGAQMTFGI